METMVSATLAFGNSQLRDEPSSGIDLASLLISLCDTATDAGCPTQYDGPDHAALVCQPVAIRRAFGNLIDNACKFGTAVQVTLRAEADAPTITDRKSVVEGKSVSVRVDVGGRRILQKKTKHQKHSIHI